MTRFEDWPQRLDAAIRAAKGRPFSWGDHDCTLFAANVVRELTGEDPAAMYRGTYSNKEEADTAIVEAGSLETLVIAALGEPISPKLAQRGDVVMIETEEDGEALGICLDHRAAFAAPVGVTLLKMSRCSKAWRV